jgi:hypothetical protein
MTFEQPASLNRFVAEPLPLTWGSRWKFIQVFLPVVAFSTIFLLETVSLKLWMMDELELSRLWPVLLVPGFLLVTYFTLGEIRLRASQGSADRLLNVLDKGISFRADARPLIRWPKVVAFWFEDIPGEPQLSKVTLEYFGPRRTKFPRRDSLVLEKRNQCSALLSELKLLQQQYNLNFRIELEHSLPPRQPPRNLILGMSLFLAGMLFLLHGVPLLLVPFTHRDGKTHHSESNDDWSPKQKEKVAKFLNAHFSSMAELNRFMIETGGVLTAIGVGLMVLGKVVQRQKTEEKLPALQPK